MVFVCLIIAVSASLIGAICGVGGGIIIKPALEAFGILEVSAVNFLSSSTVLSMALYAVAESKVKKISRIDLGTGTPLAIGAVLGGIGGKALFQMIRNNVADGCHITFIQALCLIVITAATLLYTIRMEKIRTLNVSSVAGTVSLGLVLGLLSSFFGIGGGPFILVVLYHFFSMDTKTAAENSLYIILFSQAASLVSTLVTNTVPEIKPIYLIVMICGGLAGGISGKYIYKRITGNAVKKLFIVLMTVIIAINICNAIHYFPFSS